MEWNQEETKQYWNSYSTWRRERYDRTSDKKVRDIMKTAYSIGGELHREGKTHTQDKDSNNNKDGVQGKGEEHSGNERKERMT
jgi:hypothetical protein